MFVAGDIHNAEVRAVGVEGIGRGWAPALAANPGFFLSDKSQVNEGIEVGFECWARESNGACEGMEGLGRCSAQLSDASRTAVGAEISESIRVDSSLFHDDPLVATYESEFNKSRIGAEGSLVKKSYSGITV